MRDPRIDLVVTGPDHVAQAGGEAVDSAVERELEAAHPVVQLTLNTTGDHLGAQELAGRIEEREVRSVRAQEPLRGLDHALEHFLGLAKPGHPAGDPSQRALRLDPVRECQLRGIEPRNEAGVPDRCRRVLRERAQERDLRLLEIIDRRAVRAQRSERLALGDQRRHDHRAHVRHHHDPIGHGRMGEAPVAAVVGRPNHLAPVDGSAEEAMPDRHRQVAHELTRLRVADARVDAEMEHLALAVHEIDHRAIRLEQARRLVHRVLKQPPRLVVELCVGGGRGIVEAARLLRDHARHAAHGTTRRHTCRSGVVAAEPTSLRRAATSASKPPPCAATARWACRAAPLPSCPSQSQYDADSSGADE